MNNSGFIFSVITASLAVFGLVLFWPAGASVPSGPPSDANIFCSVRWVHDGDTMRCAGYQRSTRLAAIDAPEMPGACHPNRRCVPGDPYASRDHLKALIGSNEVRCKLIETDHYGRPVMDCWAGATNLSCAMVKDGYAVERYGRISCP